MAVEYISNLGNFTGPLQEDLECPVCLETLSLEQGLKQLRCRHIYHSSCITKWLKQQYKCCVCRAQMPFSWTLAPNYVSEYFARFALALRNRVDDLEWLSRYFDDLEWRLRDYMYKESAFRMAFGDIENYILNNPKNQNISNGETKELLISMFDYFMKALTWGDIC